MSDPQFPPVPVNEIGEFDTIHTEALGVTGTDGHGIPTPTVRELRAILASLPEQFQDQPVTRYCGEGIYGISYELREHRMDDWTAHVALW